MSPGLHPIQQHRLDNCVEDPQLGMKTEVLVPPYWFQGNKGLACFADLSVHVFVCPSCFSNYTAQVCEAVNVFKGLSVDGDWSFLSGFHPQDLQRLHDDDLQSCGPGNCEVYPSLPGCVGECATRV